MEIIFIIITIFILAFMPLLIKNPRRLGQVTALGYFIVLVASFSLLTRFASPVFIAKFLYLDALSVFFVFTTGVVAVAVALFSIDYIANEVADHSITAKRARFYYVLLNLFTLSMLLVVSLNNLGLMWVAIEMTTLISAFLVGFHNTKEAVEAAWKYIIICSVGIILALLGTILFSYALLFHAGTRSLDWTILLAAAGGLNGNLLKVAFIFILVGYGTKAGLVPLHTWLPDAHSQAVSPVSALLSGILIKIALFAILRYSMVVNKCVGPVFTSHLFLFFGLLSLAVAAGFILAQKDLKRLLAYSSIEHLGIITIGLGLGGTIGLYGALLHIFNHAVTKSLLFFGAGNIIKKYQSHNLRTIKGVIRTLPFTGTLFLIGLLAVTGLPPFSIFYSELIILAAAFLKGSYLVAGLLLLLISVVFGAMIYHFGPVLFGKKPGNLTVAKEPVTGQLAFLWLLFFICFLGLLVPGPLNKIINSAVALLRGV